MSQPWPSRVSALRDRALKLLHEERFAEAQKCIDQAFSIVAKEGDENHVAFGDLACLAADFAVGMDDVEAGKALYNRAYQVGTANSNNELMAKALWGLGEAEAGQDNFAQARSRLAQARALFAASSDPEADAVCQAIDETLASLPHGD